ncbi:MAG TPA: transketolase [Gemmataceae bacterium]|nr:transketolase [Gemmataceae bacterium]
MSEITPTVDGFDLTAARERCRRFRLRILGLSQGVTAVHIAPAFSCLELVDSIYFGSMQRGEDGAFRDTFLMSKGHGSAAQYVVLEELGVLSRADLDLFCKPGGKLGTHPDHGIPGIEAATGSLGHGLPMAVGMALADKLQGIDRVVHVLLSDGELQEGSVWEAMMFAPTLRLTNLVAYVDLNDFQTLGQTSKVHPNFYPVLDKVRAFGWEAEEVDGHDHAAIVQTVRKRTMQKPFVLIGRTVKGKGVSYMENVPIWHYRSPSPAEYQQAVREIAPSPYPLPLEGGEGRVRGKEAA